MTQYEVRHINCLETLVSLLLGSIVAAFVSGIGVAIMQIPVSFFTGLGWLIICVAALVYIVFVGGVILDYSKTKSKYLPTATIQPNDKEN